MKGLNIVLIVGLVLGSALAAQDSEFIPGNDRIVEKDILRRIQEELGTDIAKDKAQQRAAEVEKAEMDRKVAERDSTLRSVTLSLKDQRQVSGTVVLSQNSVFITPEDSAQELVIPLEEVRSLEFTEWKARRMKIVEAREEAAPSADPAAADGENQGENPENSAEDPAEAGADAATADASAPESGAEKQAASARIYFLPTKCRLTRSDDTVINGRCQSMDWLQFNLTNKSAAGFRTFFAEERALPQGGSRELEKSLDTLEAEAPVDTVISVELGGFVQQPNNGTARRGE